MVKSYAVLNTRTGRFEFVDDFEGTFVTSSVDEAKDAATEYNLHTTIPENQTFTVVTLTFDLEI